VVELYVTTYWGNVAAVPRPPVVEVAEPTRNGTTCVFFEAGLIPVDSAAVVSDERRRIRKNNSADAGGGG